MEQQNEMILQIIERLTDVAGAPCKKKLQKIVYLIQERKVDLGFPYKIHIYGPYSADLDYTICELKAENKLDISYGNKGHILRNIKNFGNTIPYETPNGDTRCPAGIPYETPNGDTGCPADVIAAEIEYVINAFGGKSAKDLELISTTLYAERYKKGKSEDGIVEAVRKIKKDKFTVKEIRDAIQLLRKTDYIV